MQVKQLKIIFNLLRIDKQKIPINQLHKRRKIEILPYLLSIRMQYHDDRVIRRSDDDYRKNRVMRDKLRDEWVRVVDEHEQVQVLEV